MSDNKSNKHLVLLNVISSGGQVLLIGLVYFFLYRLLLKVLGVELLGVWSVVLSTSSLANLANLPKMIIRIKCVGLSLQHHYFY